MVTRPVTIKAILRVCFDLAATDAEPVTDRVTRWTRRLGPWSQQVRELRAEGFYERFPAKGQVERVARLHRELARQAKIEPTKRKTAGVTDPKRKERGAQRQSAGIDLRCFSSTGHSLR